jgi:hypothetical protein
MSPEKEARSAADYELDRRRRLPGSRRTVLNEYTAARNAGVETCLQETS